MTTTAIGLIIISSFLFFTQNMEKIKQTKVPEIKTETKTEIKIKDPVIVKKPIPKQEEIKKPEVRKYTPVYPDFEVFEQSEAPKEGKYTDNFNRFTKDFHKVKIRSDGIVPLKNEKFSLENPQTFSAMTGYIPGVFSIALIKNNITEAEVISTLESISGVEVVKLTQETYSYTIFFNISNLTQGEIYELEKNIKANRQIDYIEKKFITLPEYDSKEYHDAENQYYSDLRDL